MTRLSPRVLGILIGLVTSGVILAVVGHRALGPASGPVLADCEGALKAIVIQYIREADFAAPVYREFLRQLPSEVRVYVVCPDRQTYERLGERIGEVRCQLHPVITGHAMTAWSRDRWLALRPAAPGGPVTVFSPRTEAGAETWSARAGDQRIGDDLAAALHSHVASRRSSWHFDGGDFVADDQTVFVTPNVAKRNVQQTVGDRDELASHLRAVLRREVVLLNEAPDHHAGMFMMAVGNRTVLVGDPSLAGGHSFPELPGGADFSSETQRLFDAVAAQAAASGYRVVRMPLVPANDGRTWLTYLNVILDQRSGQRIVYMPVYARAATLNNEAQRIWRSLGYEVRTVDCTSAYVFSGSLRCLVNVLERG